MNVHTKTKLLKNGPKVSVLLPARNEEKNIAQCLEGLLNQNYENYDIFILNDNSTDKTLEIASAFEKKFPGKIHVINGKKLLPEWNGKTFAMQQLIEIADGEIFLFTDADTKHFPTSIAFAATNIVENNADLISGYVHQKLISFGEKIGVPSMYLLTGLVVPIFLNGILKASFFSNAIGQYIAVKADSIKKCGGYEPIKKVTTEDIFLARTMKKRGMKTFFLNLDKQCSCRMYNSYMHVVQGIGKNIFDFLKHNVFLLFCALAALFIFLVLPPFFIAFGFNTSLWIGQALCAITVLNISTWFIMLWERKNDIWIAFLYPIIFLNIIVMALFAFHRTTSGKGFNWKGRRVN